MSAEEFFALLVEEEFAEAVVGLEGISAHGRLLVAIEADDIVLVGFEAFFLELVLGFANSSDLRPSKDRMRHWWIVDGLVVWIGEERFEKIFAFEVHAVAEKVVPYHVAEGINTGYFCLEFIVDFDVAFFVGFDVGILEIKSVTVRSDTRGDEEGVSFHGALVAFFVFGMNSENSIFVRDFCGADAHMNIESFGEGAGEFRGNLTVFILQHAAANKEMDIRAGSAVEISQLSGDVAGTHDNHLFGLLVMVVNCFGASEIWSPL